MNTFLQKAQVCSCTEKKKQKTKLFFSQWFLALDENENYPENQKINQQQKNPENSIYGPQPEIPVP